MNPSPLSLVGTRSPAHPPAPPHGPGSRRHGARPEVLAEYVRRLPADAPDYRAWIALALAGAGLGTFVLAACGLPLLAPLAGGLGLLATLPAIMATRRQEHPSHTLVAFVVGLFCIHMSLVLTIHHW